MSVINDAQTNRVCVLSAHSSLLLDNNKAHICCSERTSGTGYCKTAHSRSKCTRVTDRYSVVFGKLIPRRNKSGRDSLDCCDARLSFVRCAALSSSVQF